VSGPITYKRCPHGEYAERPCHECEIEAKADLQAVFTEGARQQREADERIARNLDYTISEAIHWMPLVEWKP
jgi:hypothetical protein